MGVRLQAIFVVVSLPHNRTDHDLDHPQITVVVHLDPRLPLWDVVQDLYSTVISNLGNMCYEIDYADYVTAPARQHES